MSLTAILSINGRDYIAPYDHTGDVTFEIYNMKKNFTQYFLAFIFMDPQAKVDEKLPKELAQNYVIARLLGR